MNLIDKAMENKGISMPIVSCNIDSEAITRIIKKRMDSGDVTISMPLGKDAKWEWPLSFSAKIVRSMGTEKKYWNGDKWVYQSKLFESMTEEVEC